jgi:Arc/MetJ-type ribon-helix-helix transcriptional regulator
VSGVLTCMGWPRAYGRAERGVNDSAARHAARYGLGMARKTKITITILDDQLKEIRSLVAAGKARSVSAFVQHAVDLALYDAAGWKEMLDAALEQTGGPLTKQEHAWADGVLQSGKS